MKCKEFRLQIHDYLDERLSGQEAASVEGHLRRCIDCSEVHRQYVVLRGMMEERAHFPASAGATAMAAIRRRRAPWWRRTWTGISNCFDGFRDWDWSVVLSRSAAAPFALLLFACVFLQFAPSRSEALSFVLIPVSPSNGPVRAIVSVQGSNDREELRQLMNTAWRLPYEDSLSLVAEVQSGGGVEIDSVLEYPKSPDLLDAVHSTLRASLLDRGRNGSNRLLIFSFQKIDVYEDGQGL